VRERCKIEAPATQSFKGVEIACHGVAEGWPMQV
jgi:hypothetical protein